MMWIIIMVAVLAALGGGIVYLISRFGKLPVVGRVTEGKKVYRILCGVGMTAVIFVAVGIFMGLINAIVCLIHLALIWLICDGIAWVVKKAAKKKISYTYTAVAAIVVTAAYLSVGFYQANHVSRSAYTIATDKEIGKLRIALFADSHIGTTFDEKGFADYMDQIEKENPDVVLISGDFVDDGTTKEDMVACCEVLGRLHTTYGVYYAFGNHDVGYYGKSYRGYDGEDLKRELEKNNVTVLQDESVLVDNRFYIIGRKDKVEELRGGKRAPIGELVSDLDSDKFMVVMNHQPNDYEAEAKANVDLVLSGHTHGGQFFPVTYLGEWIGANDRTYGYEKRDKTNFIVTSGISDWEVLFKTGCKSEYVIVDIEQE